MFCTNILFLSVILILSSTVIEILYTSDDAIVGGPLSEDPNVVNTNTVTTSAAIISLVESKLLDYVQGIDNVDAKYYRTVSLTTALASDNLDIKEFDQINLNTDPWQKDATTDEKAHFRQKGFSSRSFYTGLMKDIWIAMEDTTTYGDYRETDDFKALTLKLYNELKETIRNGMLDSDGNIINYSLRNEVSQVHIDLVYRYRNS